MLEDVDSSLRAGLLLRLPLITNKIGIQLAYTFNSGTHELGQKDQELETSLGYRVSSLASVDVVKPCPKKTNSILVEFVYSACIYAFLFIVF